MRCSGCGKDLEPDTKMCPYCNKRIVASSRTRHYSGVLQQQGRVETDQDYNEDRLKPHSSVSLRGVGSRFSGSSRVRSVRHNIETSNDDSSSKVRCLSCGTVNDDSAKKCRSCGARIT